MTTYNVIRGSPSQLTGVCTPKTLRIKVFIRPEALGMSIMLHSRPIVMAETTVGT